jgi:hypothetical protein
VPSATTGSSPKPSANSPLTARRFWCACRPTWTPGARHARWTGGLLSTAAARLRIRPTSSRRIRARA